MAFILSLLFVALAVCKLLGVIAVSWLIVFLPLLILTAWILVVCFGAIVVGVILVLLHFKP